MGGEEWGRYDVAKRGGDKDRRRGSKVFACRRRRVFWRDLMRELVSIRLMAVMIVTGAMSYLPGPESFRWDCIQIEPLLHRVRMQSSLKFANSLSDTSTSDTLGCATHEQPAEYPWILFPPASPPKLRLADPTIVLLPWLPRSVQAHRRRMRLPRGIRV